MPRTILRYVFGGLAACALLGVWLGYVGVGPSRQLPGEGLTGPSVDAIDARPIGSPAFTENDTDPGVPVEEEPTEEEKAAEDAKKKAAEEEKAKLAAAKAAEKAATVAPPPPTTAPAETAPPPADKIGDLLNQPAPPDDSVPF